MLMQMKTRAVAQAVLVLLLAPTAALAVGGSGSHYKTEQDGEIEFYENGQPKKMKNGANCTGVKVVVQPVPVPAPPQGLENRGGQPRSSQKARKLAFGVAAYGHIAFQLPVDAAVASLETFTDSTLSTPLLIAGELAVWSPSAAVAAEAEAFAGPPQPGFAWRGFRTNPLMETISGTFDQDFYWVVSFDRGGYPAPGMIGTHTVSVYISDNAETPDPFVDYLTVY
jgi:hypothetical protein